MLVATLTSGNAWPWEKLALQVPEERGRVARPDDLHDLRDDVARVQAATCLTEHRTHPSTRKSQAKLVPEAGVTCNLDVKTIP